MFTHVDPRSKEVKACSSFPNVLVKLGEELKQSIVILVGQRRFNPHGEAAYL